MIYFARKPDVVFSTILRLSFDLAEFAIRHGLDTQPFGQLLPHVSLWSTPKKALKDLSWLQGILVSPVVYRITDAAMQIVYDALILFTSFHNLQVQQAPIGDSLQRVGEFMIGPIDADLVFDSFFWNEEFLDVANTAMSPRDVERIERPIWVDDAAALFRAGSTRYPDPRSGSDTLTRRDGEHVMIPMSPEIHDEMLRQKQSFRDKFGRDPGPNDPIFFDPDADTPKPIDPEKTRAVMVQAMKDAKVDPAKIYAFEKISLLPTAETMDAIGPKGMADWQSAVQEYEQKHKKRRK